MKNKCFVLALILIVLFIGCARNGTIADNDSIVGKWENDTISTEFFEDGTYFFTGPYTQRGTWHEPENGYIVFASGGRSRTGTYIVEDDILTLSFENGSRYILTRVESLRTREVGNIIPLNNREAIGEQLGRMLDIFDEDTSDADLFTILMLMAEYRRLSELEGFRENE